MAPKATSWKSLKPSTDWLSTNKQPDKVKGQSCWPQRSAIFQPFRQSPQPMHYCLGRDFVPGAFTTSHRFDGLYKNQYYSHFDMMQYLFSPKIRIWNIFKDLKSFEEY